MEYLRAAAKNGTQVGTAHLYLKVRRKSQMSKGGKENKNVSRDNQKQNELVDRLSKELNVRKIL